MPRNLISFLRYTCIIVIPSAAVACVLYVLTRTLNEQMASALAFLVVGGLFVAGGVGLGAWLMRTKQEQQQMQDLISSVGASDVEAQKQPAFDIPETLADNDTPVDSEEDRQLGPADVSWNL